MKRIEDFIRQPRTIDEYVHKGNYDKNGEYAIKIENGNFSWGVKQEEKKKKDEKEKEKDEKDDKNSKKSKEKKLDTLKDIIKDGESHRDTQNKIDDISKDLVPSSGRETKVDEINTDSNIINNNNNNNLVKEGDHYIKDNCKIEIDFPKDVAFDVTLKNINLEVKPGEILGIIGEVGSGKSSLLQAILNCLILLNPKECDGIHINGRIGYASQIPWIQNDTIKNNILFFNEYDPDKYEEILEKCQLKYDLDNFEGKDLTEIGEKGVNLSGGQKVRVSLARTVYEDPDIFLFDDPISALDANIGKKIMKELIIKYLKDKTRVVVTHALQYLKYMDRIIYMKGGRIEWVGSYKELHDQEFFLSMKKLSKLNAESSLEVKKRKKMQMPLKALLIQEEKL